MMYVQSISPKRNDLSNFIIIVENTGSPYGATFLVFSFCAVVFLRFLHILHMSFFTPKTPNKDQQVEQLLLYPDVEVL